MNILNITEYSSLVHNVGNPIAVGEGPPVRHFDIEFNEGAQKAKLSKTANILRLISTSDCRVSFGGDPSSGSVLPSGTPEYFGSKGVDEISVVIL